MSAPTLLLDVMDTLVYDPIHREIPGFFEMELATLFEVKHPDAWVRFERGELDEAAFLRSFFADGRAYDEAAFVAHVEGAYRFLPGIESLLQELREARVPMYALSNYPTWYERIERRLALSRYLDWLFVSCRTGVRKPDPEAYLGPARALDVAPAACVFVDDRDRNVRAAEAAGMRAVRFTDAASLRRELVRLDVLAGSGGDTSTG